MMELKLKKYLLLLSTLLIVISNVKSQNNVIVDVPDLGPIQGSVAYTSRDFDRYWIFHGIPYADPLSYTGENRYQPSKIKNTPLTEDGSTFFANKLLTMCPQPPIIDLTVDNAQNLTFGLQATNAASRNLKRILREKRSAELQALRNSPNAYWGIEDCLTINVNTPRIPDDPDNEDELLPVMLFFHGGGSESMFGALFPGMRLLEEQSMVLLTVNYRLGNMGAFNLMTDSAPGCQAMYDAVVALDWIQDYVRYFGGNPNKVTVSGQSAGSMMTTHLVMSPMAEDKIHGAWGFSGSALSVWGVSRDPPETEHLKVARNAGCYEDGATVDKEAVVDCMKSKSIDELVAAMSEYIAYEESIGNVGYDPRIPSIQFPNLTHPIFLAEHPNIILKEGKQNKIPLVLGATLHDGAPYIETLIQGYVLPNNLHEDPVWLRNEMLPFFMRNVVGVIDDTSELYHTFVYTYLGDSIYSGDIYQMIPGLVDMGTIFGFKDGCYKFSQEHAKAQPKSYIYSFDFKGRWSYYNIIFGFDAFIPYGGITHTDELMYCFFMGTLLNDDMRVSKRMTKYILNFVEHGDPNGDGPEDEKLWRPYDAMDHPYLSMGSHAWYDEVKYDCQDSWIGAANGYYEVPDDGNPTGPTQPTTTAETSETETEDGVVTTVPTTQSTTTEGSTPESTITTEGSTPVSTIPTEGSTPESTTVTDGNTYSTLPTTTEPSQSTTVSIPTEPTTTTSPTTTPGPSPPTTTTSEPSTSTTEKVSTEKASTEATTEETTPEGSTQSANVIAPSILALIIATFYCILI